MPKTEQAFDSGSDKAAEATAHSARLHIETMAEFERNFFTFVILHGLWFGSWFFINLGMLPGIQPFDKFPFATLQILVALEAIFLSTFVLMRQNRLDTFTDQRRHLDLQVNLLAEKETTKMLCMLQGICDRLGLKELAQDKETQRLSEETHLETLTRELKDKLPGERQ